MTANLKKLAEFINSKDSFLIVSHENPDCDAVGSTLALGKALETLGKKVVMYNRDGLNNLEFLPGSEKIINSLKGLDSRISGAFVLDCTDVLRPGEEFARFSSDKDIELVFIDHHKSNDLNGDNFLIDANASSTGILVYKLIKSLGLDINMEMAENIFATIVGDTGSFRYSNTYAETFHIAGELVSIGADPEKISQKIYETESLNKIKLMGLALDTLDVDVTKKVAFLHIDKKMFEKTGTSRVDTEGLVNIPRSIKGIEVAIMLREEELNGKRRWKASLRSKDYIDVSEIATEFGGGGHQKAAGCMIEGTVEDAKSKLYSSIKKVIK